MLHEGVTLQNVSIAWNCYGQHLDHASLMSVDMLLLASPVFLKQAELSTLSMNRIVTIMIRSTSCQQREDLSEVAVHFPNHKPTQPDMARQQMLQPRIGLLSSSATFARRGLDFKPESCISCCCPCNIL